MAKLDGPQVVVSWLKLRSQNVAPLLYTIVAQDDLIKALFWLFVEDCTIFAKHILGHGLSGPFLWICCYCPIVTGHRFWQPAFLSSLAWLHDCSLVEPDGSTHECVSADPLWQSWCSCSCRTECFLVLLAGLHDTDKTSLDHRFNRPHPCMRNCWQVLLFIFLQDWALTCCRCLTGAAVRETAPCTGRTESASTAWVRCRPADLPGCEHQLFVRSFQTPPQPESVHKHLDQASQDLTNRGLLHEYAATLYTFCQDVNLQPNSRTRTPVSADPPVRMRTENLATEVVNVLHPDVAWCCATFLQSWKISEQFWNYQTKYQGISHEIPMYGNRLCDHRTTEPSLWDSVNFSTNVFKNLQ